MSAMISLSKALLENYFVYGWPFFVLHVFVALLAFKTWHGLHREISHLRQWAPDLPPSKNSQSAQILHQFVTECESLGAQGFLVPITDFSDRLDSIIGGRVTELYERINLFLIVGIAGTLFGVFEFAFGSVAILGNESIASTDRVVALGRILSQSLSKAFPVGFVGLLLMFGAQVVVSVWEDSRLKGSVEEATSKALRRRMAVSQSQAQVVTDAAQRIETALAPLQNLQVMMAESLGPVVEALGMRLESSLGLVKEQFTHLETLTQGFSSAVSNLQTGVAVLETNTGHLGTVLAKTPQVLERLGKLQEGQEAALQAFQKNLLLSEEASRKTLDVLENAARATEELPGRIQIAAEGALQAIARNTADVAEKMANDLRERLIAVGNGLAEQLTDVATAAGAMIEEMKKVRQDTRESLERSFFEMRQESDRRWKEASDEYMRQALAQYGALIDRLESSAEKIESSLDEAAQNWYNVAANAETIIQGPLLNVLDRVGEDLRQGVQGLGNVLAEYSRAADHVHAFTDGLQQLLGQTQDIQGGLDRWLASLDRSRDELEKAVQTFQRQAAQPIRQPVAERSPELSAITTRMGRMESKLDDLLKPTGVKAWWQRIRNRD